MRSVAFLLSLVLVFSIPWENAITVGEFGTLTRVIGMLTAASWLVSALKAGFREPHPFHLVTLFFILWNVTSLFWSVGFDETVQNINTYVQLAILAWILWDLYTTPKDLRTALEAYIIGAYVTIGSSIYNYISGQEISTYSGGRYAGSELNAVDLALILTLGLPVAWHLAISAGNSIKDRILMLVNYAYIPASLFAIMLTGSRMALFAIVPAILYIVGTANRLKPFFRILIFAFLCGTLFGIQFYFPPSTVDRLATAFDSIAAGDIGGRLRLWGASMEVFSEHPLLGVGSGALGSSAALGSFAHNTFLSVLAELGLIGFILFVAMLSIVVYQAINQPKLLSMMWLTVLSIWAIGASTLTWEFRKPTWLFMILIVISASLFRRCDSERLEGTPLSAELPILPDLQGSEAKH